MDSPSVEVARLFGGEDVSGVKRSDVCLIPVLVDTVVLAFLLGGVDVSGTNRCRPAPSITKA